MRRAGDGQRSSARPGRTPAASFAKKVRRLSRDEGQGLLDRGVDQSLRADDHGRDNLVAACD